MTATLCLRSQEWVHRKVERTTFVDPQTVHRSISLDFTLPYWFHHMRGTPNGEAKRQLIPLGFLRKGTLVNFSLRNESNASLPLLNTGQNRQVAEAVLDRVGEAVLGQVVPAPISCDIRHVVEATPSRDRPELADLFGRPDAHSVLRRQLKSDAVFRVFADELYRSFLALTMIDIGCHQRRIVTLSYDESAWRNRSSLISLRPLEIATLGRPRELMLTIPAVADADSYHFEFEAPQGLQVTARVGYDMSTNPNEPVRAQASAAGSYRRAHVHFSQTSQGQIGIVSLQLSPLPSAVVRAGVIAGTLILAAVLLVRFNLDYLRQARAGIAPIATLLLALPGLVVAQLVRAGENPITTELLVPVRIVAAVPAVAALISAGAVLGSSNVETIKWILEIAAAIALVTTSLLLFHWLRLSARMRRESE